jgi:hypothetical protein
VKATVPCVGFSVAGRDEAIAKDASSSEDAVEVVHAEWSVAIADICEIRKVGGYGWKAKLVVGWSMGREVADGLEIITQSGDTFKVTALPMRDALFNRLIAMGGQKWEAW